jgi:hypothetical protein
MTEHTHTHTHTATRHRTRKAIVLTVGVIHRHPRQLSQARKGPAMSSPPPSGPLNLLGTRSFACMPVCSGQCAGDEDPISVYCIS